MDTASPESLLLRNMNLCNGLLLLYSAGVLSVARCTMDAYFLIVALAALVLLVVWRWDERARRAELDRRRRFRLNQTSPHPGGTTSSAPLRGSIPSAAGQ